MQRIPELGNPASPVTYQDDSRPEEIRYWFTAKSFDYYLSFLLLRAWIYTYIYIQLYTCSHVPCVYKSIYIFIYNIYIQISDSLMCPILKSYDIIQYEEIMYTQTYTKTWYDDMYVSVCMCVFTYVCMHVYIYIYIQYTYVYEYIYNKNVYTWYIYTELYPRTPISHVDMSYYTNQCVYY